MTSDVIATGSILILFKHIVLSSILVNNRVIVIENRQKNFQLQLQLQLQQNRVINYNFVNYNYNFSKPAPGCCNFLQNCSEIVPALGLLPLSRVRVRVLKLRVRV